MLEEPQSDFTEIELEYIEQAKIIGSKYGDSAELSSLCKKAYKDYQEKNISSKAYNRIYGICMNYAYPR